MKAVIQANIITSNGALRVAPNAKITIRDANTGSLASLYESIDGTGNPGNPLYADASGFFRVYAETGAYNIYVSTDYGSQTYFDVPCISYEALHDIQVSSESARDMALLAAGIFSDIATGVASTSDGEFFLVPGSASADALTIYRNDLGTATEITSFKTPSSIEALVSQAKTYALSSESYAALSEAYSAQSLSYRDEARDARDEAVAVVYDGTASVTPSPGMIPVAQADSTIHYGYLPLFGAFGNLSSAICNLPLLAPDDAIKLQGDLQYLCESDTTHIDRYGVLHKNAYYSGTPTATDGFSITDSGATFGDLSGYVVYLTDGTNVAYRWVDAATATKVLWRKPVAFTPTSYKLSRPRFEKDGLLVEGASTNLFTYSEDMTNAAWLKQNVVISPDSALAPDGTMTADKMVGESSVDSMVHYVQRALSAEAGIVYTESVFAMAQEVRYLTLWFGGTAFVQARAKFDLVTGEVLGATGNAIDVGIAPTAIPGMYRCHLAAMASVTGSSLYRFAMDNDAASTNNYSPWVGDGTSGMVLWGAQFEALPFASSYIPTTSAAVTRAITNENLPRYGNLPSLYNDFSIITRASFLGYGEDNTLLAVGTDLVVALNSDRKVVVTYNGTTITGTTALDANTEYSIGIGKSGTTITLYIDGASDGSDTVTPAESSEELIALGHTAGTKHWWGRIAEYRTYDHALSAAEWRLLA